MIPDLLTICEPKSASKLESPLDTVGNEWLAKTASVVYRSIRAPLRQHGVARLKLLEAPQTLGLDTLQKLLLATSAAIGWVVPQSSERNTVARIQNDGKQYALHTTRGHQTNSALAFHSDRSDLNVLLYVRVHATGGELSVVSYEEAAARLRQVDAGAHATLFSGFPVDLREERWFPSIAWHWRPILWHHRGAIRGHYIRRFVSDSQRHSDCPRLTARQADAMDRFDEVLASLRASRTFAPRAGELLFLNNYRVMHARSSYADAANGEHRRLALRTWVAPYDSEELPTFLHPLAGRCEAGCIRGGVTPQSGTELLAPPDRVQSHSEEP